jgi:inosose dehydratase
MGFRPVIHPHAGTYLETDAEIEALAEALDGSLVGLCLDTGHLTYGGADPVQRIRDHGALITHVHLKDCRRSVLDEVRAAGGGVRVALARGVFTPLGEGDVDLPGVLDALGAIGYQGWLVIEQDTALTAQVTRRSLVDAQRRNLEHVLRLLAAPAG